MGIEATESPVCFPEHEVHNFFAAPRWVDKEEAEITHVYVAIDPNTGTGDASAKQTSDFALVAGYDLLNAFVICALESIDARRPEDYMGKIVGTIKRLQARKSMQHAKFIIIHENNGSTSAGWIRRALTRYEEYGIRNVICMDENELKDGVKTTHLIKRDMMERLHDLLHRHCIILDSRIVSSSEADPNGGVEAKLEEFKRQLLTFQEVKIIPEDVLAPVKVGWTGKLSAGMKDDMAMALMLLVYWKKVFCSSLKYQLHWP